MRFTWVGSWDEICWGPSQVHARALPLNTMCQALQQGHGEQNGQTAFSDAYLVSSTSADYEGKQYRMWIWSLIQRCIGQWCARCQCQRKNCRTFWRFVRRRRRRRNTLESSKEEQCKSHYCPSELEKALGDQFNLCTWTLKRKGVSHCPSSSP